MTLGWDIGGVNTKVARVAGGRVVAVRSSPFELQRDPGALVPLLRSLATDVGITAGDVHAVTMTAELSQMFRTKRDGVAFVLDAVEAAFPADVVRVYAVDGRFLSTQDARSEPLAVAAANWAATTRVVARHVPDALLIDIGTTTTDIVPIVGGVLRAHGWTDPDRLASGELVYSGAVRTPVEAMASRVPFGDAEAGLSAEGFALAGDVHIWRGELNPADYSVPTPDGRPATREFAGERLARSICADREMLDAEGVTAIADALARAQVERIAEAIAIVCARHPSLRTAVVTGLGDFIAARAARRAGLHVVALSSALGDGAARCAPASSVALLLEGGVAVASAPARRTLTRALNGEQAVGIHTVVKIGGGLLAHDGCLDKVLEVIADTAADRSLLVVPGGGPFADAVRAQDARLGLPDDEAHWMAVLAMDQYAHLIASRLPGARVVSDADAIGNAVRSGRVPVLAPSTWLRREDPLPHSWDVTSDSIAAWVTGQLRAPSIVLVKPPGAGEGGLVDEWFERALPADVDATVVPADRMDDLRAALLGTQRDAGVHPQGAARR